MRIEHGSGSTYLTPSGSEIRMLYALRAMEKLIELAVTAGVDQSPSSVAKTAWEISDAMISEGVKRHAP